MEFLEGLAVTERSAQIQDWDTSGRVYQDYIRVIQTLQAIQQVLQQEMSICLMLLLHWTLKWSKLCVNLAFNRFPLKVIFYFTYANRQRAQGMSLSVYTLM